MTLPINPPYLPMEALLVKEIPKGVDWQYEPKWDGFRCLVFRDGRKVELQSKSGQTLGRYFPEIVEAILKLKATQFVIDGELIITIKGEPSFDDLLQRIHPAASRVAKLAVETPAQLVVFDLLVDESGKALFDEPLAKRRKKLEAFAKKYFAKNATIDLSPQTSDVTVARKWLNDPSVRLDGVIAKRLDLPYRSGERDGMQKVKKLRTADCVIGGFRYASSGKIVGSLLLGLYDEEGLLHHVGFTSSFTEAEKKELTKLLEPLIKPPGFTGNKPGGPSRWSTKKTSEWEPLQTRLVAEIRYDHFTGGRFRHGTKFLRWRPDKKLKQCGYDQLGKGGTGQRGKG
ncbi:MAG: ATP-dependent DNA ligase [bacterium]